MSNSSKQKTVGDASKKSTASDQATKASVAVPLTTSGGGFSASGIFQRMGNAGVASLLSGLQGSTRIDPSNSSDENEADRVADVLANHSSGVAGQPLDNKPKQSAYPTTGLASASGAPLSSSSRHFFESRLGHDFDAVRVHTDKAAETSARALNARAFTLGQHVAFAAGCYQPDSAQGRRLLAHELTHTVQQRGRSIPLIQRTPTTESNVVAEISPLEALRVSAEQLHTQALPQFQQAMDNVDESAVRQAGDFVLAVWLNLESSYQQAGPSSHGIEPLPVTPAPRESPVCGEDENPWDIYQRARHAVLLSISSQKYMGHYVRGSPQTPSYEGNIDAFIAQQVADLSWLVRDTVSMLSLLQEEQISESNQWTVVGLLRQHMNPWEFSYMLAVLRHWDVYSKLARFAESPRRGYVQLVATQEQIISEGQFGPSQGMGLFELIPAQGKIRLLQPFSPREIAEQLYGRPEHWQDILLPYNRAALQGVGENSWLEFGTQLIVNADLLIDRYRAVFLSALQARSAARENGTDPYLWMRPDETVVLGNEFTVGVSWPNSFFANTRLQWWIENDPVAVREEGVNARIDGPRGTLSMDSRDTENTAVELVAEAPGNHVVKCRLTSQDGDEEVLSQVITAMTLEQKTDIEFQRDFNWHRRPQQVLEQLREERDNLPASSDQRRQLDERITEMEETLREADAESNRYLLHRAHLSPVRAMYVSEEDQPMTVPLLIYVDTDPGYFDAPGYVLKLWDFTLQGSIREYPARGVFTQVAESPQEALRYLFRIFADDAPYPDGNMRFQITPSTMGYSGLSRETVTYPTDGGDMWTSALRALSIGSMVVGAGAALLGQFEVAVPLFYLSGALAGAAGAYSIYDRLSHGDFEWDVQAGIDILDIAGALLTFGVSSRVTATARGVGQLSIGGRMQLTVGYAQIAIMAGTHVAHINAAIRTGNRDEVARALLQALADGALILIVHRASARMQRPAGAGRRPGVSEGRRTMTGTGPGEGAPRSPTDLPEPTARPDTPEYHRQAHEAWATETRRSGLGPREATQPAAEPLTLRDDFTNIHEAQRVFDDMVARHPQQEVGLYRNGQSGRYAVRLGSEFEVGGPRGGGWETVVHSHPNQANVLTRRMPAPADVDGAAVDALRAGRPITEFIDYPMPDGSRGRTAYTTTPDGQVTVEYSRPDGTPVRRRFNTIQEYQRSYSSRTTYVDPQSSEYRWIREDLDDFYRYQRSAGGRTMAGSVGGGSVPRRWPESISQQHLERMLDTPGSGFERMRHPGSGNPISEPGFSLGEPLNMGRHSAYHARRLGNATFPDIYGTEAASGQRMAMELKTLGPDESVFAYLGRDSVRREITVELGGRSIHLPENTPNYLVLDIRQSGQSIPSAVDDIATVMPRYTGNDGLPVWDGVRFITGTYSAPVLSPVY